MARTITVSASGYVDGTPLRIRPQLVSFVYSMADHHGWQIRVAGQRWNGDNGKAIRRLARHGYGITDDEWAMLMNYRPS